MEKSDLIAGLNQAIARGDSLERAKQSFINAGYSKQDVEDSANTIDNSVSSLSREITPTTQIPNKKIELNMPQIPQPNKKQEAHVPNFPEIPKPSQKQQETNKESKPRKNKLGKILIFIIVFLLIILGVSLYLL